MNETKIIEMLFKHNDDLEQIKEQMATKNDVRAMSNTLDIAIGIEFHLDLRP